MVSTDLNVVAWSLSLVGRQEKKLTEPNTNVCGIARVSEKLTSGRRSVVKETERFKEDDPVGNGHKVARGTANLPIRQRNFDESSSEYCCL